MEGEKAHIPTLALPGSPKSELAKKDSKIKELEAQLEYYKDLLLKSGRPATDFPQFTTTDEDEDTDSTSSSSRKNDNESASENPSPGGRLNSDSVSPPPEIMVDIAPSDEDDTDDDFESEEEEDESSDCEGEDTDTHDKIKAPQNSPSPRRVSRIKGTRESLRRGSSAFYELLAGGAKKLGDSDSDSEIRSQSSIYLSSGEFSSSGTSTVPNSTCTSCAVSPCSSTCSSANSSEDSLNIAPRPQWLFEHGFDDLDAYRSGLRNAKSASADTLPSLEPKTLASMNTSPATYNAAASILRDNTQVPVRRRRADSTGYEIGCPRVLTSGEERLANNRRQSNRRGSLGSVESQAVIAKAAAACFKEPEPVRRPRSSSAFGMDDTNVHYGRMDAEHNQTQTRSDGRNAQKLKRLSMMPMRKLSPHISPPLHTTTPGSLMMMRSAPTSPVIGKLNLVRTPPPSEEKKKVSISTSADNLIGSGPIECPLSPPAMEQLAAARKERRRSRDPKALKELFGLSQLERHEQELLDTEESYIGGLKTLQLMETIAKEGKMLEDEELKTLFFKHLDVLISIHESFLQKLKERTEPLKNILAGFVPTLKAYATYYSHHVRGSRMIKRSACQAKLALIAERTTQLLSASAETQDNEQAAKPAPVHFESVYIIPIQRLPRYEMLLAGLAKHSDKEEDKQMYEKLKTDMEHINTQLNDELNRAENIAKMNEIQSLLGHSKNKLGYVFSLFDKPRTFIGEGKLQLRTRRGSATVAEQFFLFDDILLNTSPYNEKASAEEELQFKRLFYLTPNRNVLKAALAEEFENGVVLVDSTGAEAELRLPTQKYQWLALFKKVSAA